MTNQELVNHFANLAIEDHGSFVRVHPIDKLMKVRCREDTLNQIKTNKYINNDYILNIKRLNRWWWSISFIERV